MVANRPKANAPERSTLIVVPATLVSNSLGFLLYYNWIPVSLHQWEAEIERHTGSTLFPRVMIFKQSEKVSMIRVTDCDIVLTSYWELSNSCVFPKGEEMRELRKELKDNPNAVEEWIEDHRENGGFLHKITWHRVSRHSDSSSAWWMHYWRV